MYGIPMSEPLYSPDPKSGCSPMLEPMKLMIALEFGSTQELEMSVFQRLVEVNGRNPFKLPPTPVLITLQAVV